ncbi:hypothetical protein [Micromonospora sp. NPDC049891]|uniref:hypothetical protein n=1 Tax=Micromonospora sp. NPDC049891 TaxID=3155655 RepID=UPI0033C99CDE
MIEPLMYPDPGVPVSAVPYTPAPDTRGWLDTAITWATNPDNTMTVVAVILGLLLAVKVLRSRRKPATGRNADDITGTDRALTRISATIATVVVALGMWQFFTDVINIHWSLRLVLFAFIEIGIVDAARRATRHLYRHGDLGRAHRAVFILAGISASLSAVHADSVDLRLFRIAAAVVASYMWYESLIEQRDILHHRNPGKYPPPSSRGIPWRRIAVTLGLAEPTSISVSEVATLRRMDRLSRLLNHFHNVTATPKPGRIKRLYTAWLGWRVMRQTQAACKWIDLAENPEVRARLLRRLSIVRGIVEATKPGAVSGDAWADVTQIETGDADRRRHIIDVEATPASDAPRHTPAVTVEQTPTPVTPTTTTVTTDATQPATTTGDVTVKRTRTDVSAVRPLSRDLIDARFRDWTVEQVRDYAAKKARQVVDGGGSKREGMKVFLLLCMALGVEPAGTWMAEAVEGAESAARTNRPKWLAELAVADAEQILLAEHRRIVSELTAGDGRD